MATETTNRKPAERTKKKRPAESRPVSDIKKPVTAEKDAEDTIDFDFDFDRADQPKENLDDTQHSLRLMIDELTEEAVEQNTKSEELKIEKSMIDELIPLYTVELEDEEEEPEEPKKFRVEMLIPIILALIALCAGLFAIFGGKDKPKEKPTDESAVVLIEETPEPEEDAEETKIQELRADVVKILEGADGTWSVYLKNLDTGKKFVINDTQMASASLIKLFTAGRYLEMVENGELVETEASAFDLTAMISWSDNDAWEEMETIIGYGDYNSGLISVTDFAQRNGFTNSGRLIGTESIYDEEAENLTTAAEVGTLLEQIAKGTYVSEEASERLYSLMESQAYVYKIPAGLPEGFEYASKSGEWPGIENDAAIIKGPDTEYILVVMSNDFYDGTAAADLIVQISNLCAVRLNPSIQ